MAENEKPSEILTIKEKIFETELLTIDVSPLFHPAMGRVRASFEP